MTFIAQLMPSRTDVPQYAEYLERIEALVAVVNHRHGTPDWMPIQLKLRDDLDEAMAAYKHYDVLLVNAMFDGMNLVAKEGPIVNEREGVSILSENTGAHEELGEYALSVNPFDIQELADSIYAALTMAPEERAPARARAGGDRDLARSGRLDRRAAGRHPRQGALASRRAAATRYSAPSHDPARAHIRSRAAARPAVEEDVRAKILADTRAAIVARRRAGAPGRLGRPRAGVPDRPHADAEYHLLQFHAGTPELLSDLDRTLRITDGVLRFRIVKLQPGTPEAPDMRTGAAAPGRPRRRSARRRSSERLQPLPPEAEVAVGEPAAEQYSEGSASATSRRRACCNAEARSARAAPRVITSRYGLGQDMSERRRAGPTCCGPRRRCSSRGCWTRCSRVHPLVPVIDVRARRSSLLTAWSLSNVSVPGDVGLAIGGLRAVDAVRVLAAPIVFHFEPEDGFGARLHWIIHGVHHDHPNDPLRLVMPPAVSVPLGAGVFGLLYLVFGSDYAPGLGAGFFAGYLVYDMIHYYVHHFRPRGRLGRMLRERHMRHHFQDETAASGSARPTGTRCSAPPRAQRAQPIARMSGFATRRTEHRTSGCAPQRAALDSP